MQGKAVRSQFFVLLEADADRTKISKPPDPTVETPTGNPVGRLTRRRRRYPCPGAPAGRRRRRIGIAAPETPRGVPHEASLQWVHPFRTPFSCRDGPELQH